MADETETRPHQIRCLECEQPMRWRGGRTSWEGDWELETARYECVNACQVSAEVIYRHFIPIDVARLRPDQ